jgi:hypothetical protein
MYLGVKQSIMDDAELYQEVAERALAGLPQDTPQRAQRLDDIVQWLDWQKKLLKINLVLLSDDPAQIQYGVMLTQAAEAEIQSLQGGPEKQQKPDANEVTSLRHKRAHAAFQTLGQMSDAISEALANNLSRFISRGPVNEIKTAPLVSPINRALPLLRPAPSLLPTIPSYDPSMLGGLNPEQKLDASGRALAVLSAIAEIQRLFDELNKYYKYLTAAAPPEMG